MPDFGAAKRKSTLLVLFIPSAGRDGASLGRREQSRWVKKALKVLGKHFGGATAYPRGWGVWRDDERGGALVWDKPILIQCYTSEELLEAEAGVLREFLRRMGRETGQGAVGFVIDRDFYTIDFPVAEG